MAGNALSKKIPRAETQRVRGGPMADIFEPVLNALEPVINWIDNSMCAVPWLCSIGHASVGFICAFYPQLIPFPVIYQLIDYYFTQDDILFNFYEHVVGFIIGLLVS